MFTGKIFDPDRHGAQCCIEISENNKIVITHYDFGELPITPPTAKQLNACYDFFQSLRWTLAKSKFLTIDLKSELEDQLNKFIHDNKNHDLLRLRRIRKGILALQDYFAVLTPYPKLLDCLLEKCFETYLSYAHGSGGALGLLSFFSGEGRIFTVSVPSGDSPAPQGDMTKFSHR